MHELNPQKRFFKDTGLENVPWYLNKTEMKPLPACFGYEKSFGTQCHLERSVSVCFIKISIFPISFSNGKMDI